MDADEALNCRLVLLGDGLRAAACRSWPGLDVYLFTPLWIFLMLWLCQTTQLIHCRPAPRKVR